MRTLKRTIPLIFLLLLITISAGLIAYVSGTAGTRPSSAVVLEWAMPTIPPLNGVPITRFAQLDNAILDVVLRDVSPYGSQNLTTLPHVQSVGAYLPFTGNTQFTLLGATPMPTPLAYPTSPPLPLPAIAGQLLPTLEGYERTLPYGGDGCAPAGLPVEGILTQRFHAFHSGVDIGVGLGTPVLATHSGIVTFADWSEIGYGYLVIIQNGSFITYYAHNMSFNVKTGDNVGKGSIVSWSGSTGNSTGPHVHYETRINDVPVDPLTFEDRGYATC